MKIEIYIYYELEKSMPVMMFPSVEGFGGNGHQPVT